MAVNAGPPSAPSRVGADALGELHGPERAGAGQDHGELVAADAVAAVRGALGRADRVGQGLEALVAGLVAVRVVGELEVVDVEQRERERLAGAPDAPELTGEVLLEGAVVAQAGERVGHRDLGQARDLGRARRRQARAQPQEQAGQGGEQADADGEGEGRRDEDVALQAARLGGVREPGGGRSARGAGDAVLEHAVGRVDDLVLEVLLAAEVAGVDGGEQAPARGTVGPLQGEQPRDVAGGGRRRVEHGRAAQRGGQAAGVGGVVGADAVGALEAVLALGRLLLADPVPRALQRGGEAPGGLGALREVARPALGDEREAAQREQHGEDRRHSRADGPAFVDPFQS